MRALDLVSDLLVGWLASYQENADPSCGQTTPVHGEQRWLHSSTADSSYVRGLRYPAMS
jgi:hypothetical protein